MIRMDAAVFALGTIGITAAEGSFQTWMTSAATAGTIIGAGWLLDARIKKTVKGEIESHTAVEEARMDTVKAEFTGEIKRLGEKLDGINDSVRNLKSTLTVRPCISCDKE